LLKDTKKKEGDNFLYSRGKSGKKDHVFRRKGAQSCKGLTVVENKTFLFSRENRDQHKGGKEKKDSHSPKDRLVVFRGKRRNLFTKMTQRRWGRGSSWNES